MTEQPKFIQLIRDDGDLVALAEDGSTWRYSNAVWREMPSTRLSRAEVEAENAKFLEQMRRQPPPSNLGGVEMTWEQRNEIAVEAGRLMKEHPEMSFDAATLGAHAKVLR